MAQYDHLYIEEAKRAEQSMTGEKWMGGRQVLNIVVEQSLPLRRHLQQYEDEILPLRKDADEGAGEYDEYDQAYNEWLEKLHQLAKDLFSGKRAKETTQSVQG